MNENKKQGYSKEIRQLCNLNNSLKDISDKEKRMEVEMIMKMKALDIIDDIDVNHKMYKFVKKLSSLKTMKSKSGKVLYNYYEM